MGKQGRDLAIDVVITDTRNDTNAAASATTTGAARDKKVLMKTRKYEELCHQCGYSFLAAALEIFGSMTDKLDSLIKRLVEKASDAHKSPSLFSFPTGGNVSL